MTTNCTTQADVAPKLRKAILRTLKESGDMNVGELADFLEEFGFDFDEVFDAVEKMLFSRELLTGWAFSQFDESCDIGVLALHLGQTSVTEVTKQTSCPPCRDVINHEGRREIAWTIYVDEPDEDQEMPQITIPYEQRDMAEPNRPAGCNLPFVPVIPPERIELVTWFDAQDRLVDSAIRVRV